MPQHDFPPNIPKKLIQVYKAEKLNCRATARRLKVNPGLLWKLLNEGTEPQDKDLRKKVFLPGKVRKPVPAWVVEATEILARLEREAGPDPNRTYNRKGKRT